MFSGTAGKILEVLGRYSLKEESPGHYRSNSPLRPGSDSHAFILRIDDDEHGAYFDHVSQESGSLYELAAALGITPQADSVAVASTKRAYNGIEDYAKAHGITAEVLKRAGWYETIHMDRPALAFHTVNGTRWRFIDGDKPYYISEKGYKACWYGLNSHLAKRLVDQPLVICNGEISTIVARQYGIAATCVTSGEKGIPPHLLQELKEFLGPEDDSPPIIVALDCDDTGRRVGRMVAEQLRSEGLIAKAVDLGLGRGGDLADFCMLHGTQASRQLNLLPTLANDEHQTAPQARRWYIIPAAELRNLPPITWIVPGEIPERGITVIFGRSGSGKSFLALDYALRIAQDSPVLYMAGEGEYGYRQRVAAWCQHHHKTEGQLYMCIGAVQLMEPQDLQAFLAANAAIHPRAVFVDTLARSMVGSDENSTRDMGIFIQACEEIKRTLDCAVVIIHHTNKGGIQERGNSALRGASDAMIKVTDEDDVVISVESVKTKDAQPFPTRYVRLLPVDVAIGDQKVSSAVIIEATRIIQTAGDQLTLNQQKILGALSLEIFNEGARHQEIADQTGIPFHSLARILSRLIALGFVQQNGKREPYVITESGRAALARYDRSDHPSDHPKTPVFSLSNRSDRSDHPLLTSDQKKTSDDYTDHTDQKVKQENLFALFDSDAEYFRRGA